MINPASGVLIKNRLVDDRGYCDRIAYRYLSNLAQNETTGILNVTDFGAVGNGTVDDRQAIQAALDAVPTGGTVVFLPIGRYRLSAPLTINIDGTQLIGAGWGSVLAPDAGIDAIHVSTTRSCFKVRLAECSIDGTTSLTGRGIVLGLATPQYATAFTLLDHVQIENFSGSGGRGVRLVSTQETQLRDCRLSANEINVHFPAPGTWGVDGYLTSLAITGMAGYVGGAVLQGIKLDGLALGVVLSDIVVESNLQGAVLSTGPASCLSLHGCYFENNATGGGKVLIVHGVSGISATLHCAGNAFVEAVAAFVLDLDHVSAYVAGNGSAFGGLWRGVNSVTTTATTTAVFVGNNGDGAAIPTYVGALLGEITAFEPGIRRMTNLPASAAGLVTGDLWNNGGAVSVV